MYDIQLMHIYGSSHFCSGKYAVGVYLDKSSRSAILIDSGSDENIARAIDKEITNRGYRISGILHTHGHRNNFGGDRYFLENYPEVRIYSTPSAVAWVSHEAIYCGEIPFQHAHREPIPATDLLEDRDGSFLIGEAEFKVVALPGHVPGMVGFISPDNVLYCGDALFGEKILKVTIQVLFKCQTTNLCCTWRKFFCKLIPRIGDPFSFILVVVRGAETCCVSRFSKLVKKIQRVSLHSLRICLPPFKSWKHA